MRRFPKLCRTSQVTWADFAIDSGVGTRSWPYILCRYFLFSLCANTTTNRHILSLQEPILGKSWSLAQTSRYLDRLMFQILTSGIVSHEAPWNLPQRSPRFTDIMFNSILSCSAVTFTNDLPASQAGSNDASGTIRIHAVNVSLYNLNIANTFGKVCLPVRIGNSGCRSIFYIAACRSSKPFLLVLLSWILTKRNEYFFNEFACRHRQSH